MTTTTIPLSETPIFTATIRDMIDAPRIPAPPHHAIRDAIRDALAARTDDQLDDALDELAFLIACAAGMEQLIDYPIFEDPIMEYAYDRAELITERAR